MYAIEYNNGQGWHYYAPRSMYVRPDTGSEPALLWSDRDIAVDAAREMGKYFPSFTMRVVSFERISEQVV
jgi:hypothetical protein